MLPSWVSISFSEKEDKISSEFVWGIKWGSPHEVFSSVLGNKVSISVFISWYLFGDVGGACVHTHHTFFIAAASTPEHVHTGGLEERVGCLPQLTGDFYACLSRDALGSLPFLIYNYRNKVHWGQQTKMAQIHNIRVFMPPLFLCLFILLGRYLNISFKCIYFILYVWMFGYMYVCAKHVWLVPLEVRRGHWIPFNRGYR